MNGNGMEVSGCEFIKVYPRIFVESLRRNTKILSKGNGVPPEIRSAHLSNTSVE